MFRKTPATPDIASLMAGISSKSPSKRITPRVCRAFAASENGLRTRARTRAPRRRSSRAVEPP